MKELDGKRLLGTLVDLLAKQEGVKVSYRIEENGKGEQEWQSLSSPPKTTIPPKRTADTLA